MYFFDASLEYYSFLAKILMPEGSKDVGVGQPIAITVISRITISKFWSQVRLHWPLESDIREPFGKKEV